VGILFGPPIFEGFYADSPNTPALRREGPCPSSNSLRVLRQSGYDAQSAMVSEAELLLLTEEFDLIIVSAFLDEWEKGRVLSAADKMPTLVLRGLTLAPALLVEVERVLEEIG
jgi:hypothetical protein